MLLGARGEERKKGDFELLCEKSRVPAVGHSETECWEMGYRTVGRKQPPEPSRDQFPSGEELHLSLKETGLPQTLSVTHPRAWKGQKQECVSDIVIYVLQGRTKDSVILLYG